MTTAAAAPGKQEGVQAAPTASVETENANLRLENFGRCLSNNKQ